MTMTQFYRQHKVDSNTLEWQKCPCGEGVVEDLTAGEIKMKKFNALKFPQIVLDWLVISQVACLLESINKTCSIIQEDS